MVTVMIIVLSAMLTVERTVVAVQYLKISD